MATVAADCSWRVRVLSRSSSPPIYAGLVEEFARLERRIFPKHESLSASFAQEVRKRNQIVLYVLQDDAVKGTGDVEKIADPANVAGYLMYSWTSLAASITKLADPIRSAAVALYKKNGFFVETTVKSYYAADRAAWRMVLELTSPEDL